MYSDNNATATTPSSLFYITLSYLSLQKKKKKPALYNHVCRLVRNVVAVYPNLAIPIVTSSLITAQVIRNFEPVSRHILHAV